MQQQQQLQQQLQSQSFSPFFARPPFDRSVTMSGGIPAVTATDYAVAMQQHQQRAQAADAAAAAEYAVAIQHQQRAHADAYAAALRQQQQQQQQQHHHHQVQQQAVQAQLQASSVNSEQYAAALHHQQVQAAAAAEHSRYTAAAAALMHAADAAAEQQPQQSPFFMTLQQQQQQQQDGTQQAAYVAAVHQQQMQQASAAAAAAAVHQKRLEQAVVAAAASGDSAMYAAVLQKLQTAVAIGKHSAAYPSVRELQAAAAEQQSSYATAAAFREQQQQAVAAVQHEQLVAAAQSNYFGALAAHERSSSLAAFHQQLQNAAYFADSAVTGDCHSSINAAAATAALQQQKQQQQIQTSSSVGFPSHLSMSSPASESRIEEGTNPYYEAHSPSTSSTQLPLSASAGIVQSQQQLDGSTAGASGFAFQQHRDEKSGSQELLHQQQLQQLQLEHHTLQQTPQQQPFRSRSLQRLSVSNESFPPTPLFEGSRQSSTEGRSVSPSGGSVINLSKSVSEVSSERDGTKSPRPQTNSFGSNSLSSLSSEQSQQQILLHQQQQEQALQLEQATLLHEHVREQGQNVAAARQQQDEQQTLLHQQQQAVLQQQIEGQQQKEALQREQEEQQTSQREQQEALLLHEKRMQREQIVQQQYQQFLHEQRNCHILEKQAAAAAARFYSQHHNTQIEESHSLDQNLTTSASADAQLLAAAESSNISSPTNSSTYSQSAPPQQCPQSPHIHKTTAAAALTNVSGVAQEDRSGSSGGVTAAAGMITKTAGGGVGGGIGGQQYINSQYQHFHPFASQTSHPPFIGTPAVAPTASSSLSHCNGGINMSQIGEMLNTHPFMATTEAAAAAMAAAMDPAEVSDVLQRAQQLRLVGALPSECVGRGNVAELEVALAELRRKTGIMMGGGGNDGGGNNSDLPVMNEGGGGGQRRLMKEGISWDNDQKAWVVNVRLFGKVYTKCFPVQNVGFDRSKCLAENYCHSLIGDEKNHHMLTFHQIWNFTQTHQVELFERVQRYAQQLQEQIHGSILRHKGREMDDTPITSNSSTTGGRSRYNNTRGWGLVNSSSETGEEAMAATTATLAKGGGDYLSSSPIEILSRSSTMMTAAAAAAMKEDAPSSFHSLTQRMGAEEECSLPVIPEPKLRILSAESNVEDVSWNSDKQAWVVAFKTPNGRRGIREFSIGKIGDIRLSLHLAILWKFECETTVPMNIASLDVPSLTEDATKEGATTATREDQKTTTVTSGHKGIHWRREKGSWCVEWFEDGTRRRKNFSSKRLGIDESLAEAIKWRREVEAKGLSGTESTFHKSMAIMPTESALTAVSLSSASSSSLPLFSSSTSTKSILERNGGGGGGSTGSSSLKRKSRDKRNTIASLHSSNNNNNTNSMNMTTNSITSDMTPVLKKLKAESLRNRGNTLSSNRLLDSPESSGENDNEKSINYRNSYNSIHKSLQNYPYSDSIGNVEVVSSSSSSSSNSSRDGGGVEIGNILSAEIMVKAEELSSYVRMTEREGMEEEGKTRKSCGGVTEGRPEGLLENFYGSSVSSECMKHRFEASHWERKTMPPLRRGMVDSKIEKSSLIEAEESPLENWRKRREVKALFERGVEENVGVDNEEEEEVGIVDELVGEEEEKGVGIVNEMVGKEGEVGKVHEVMGKEGEEGIGKVDEVVGDKVEERAVLVNIVMGEEGEEVVGKIDEVVGEEGERGGRMVIEVVEEEEEGGKVDEVVGEEREKGVGKIDELVGEEGEKGVKIVDEVVRKEEEVGKVGEVVGEEGKNSVGEIMEDLEVERNDDRWDNFSSPPSAATNGQTAVPPALNSSHKYGNEAERDVDRMEKNDSDATAAVEDSSNDIIDYVKGGFAVAVAASTEANCSDTCDSAVMAEAHENAVESIINYSRNVAIESIEESRSDEEITATVATGGESKSDEDGGDLVEMNRSYGGDNIIGGLLASRRYVSYSDSAVTYTYDRRDGVCDDRSVEAEGGENIVFVAEVSEKRSIDGRTTTTAMTDIRDDVETSGRSTNILLPELNTQSAIVTETNNTFSSDDGDVGNSSTLILSTNIFSSSDSIFSSSFSSFQETSRAQTLSSSSGRSDSSSSTISSSTTSSSLSSFGVCSTGAQSSFFCSSISSLSNTEEFDSLRSNRLSVGDLSRRFS